MESIVSRIEVINKAIGKLNKLKQIPEIVEQIEEMNKLVEGLEIEAEKVQVPWDKVCLAREMERPRAKYYIEQMVTDFIELHGDRSFSDDQAIIGGIGKIGPHTVTIVAQNKGNSAKENIKSNFGMPYPEGYRKALRLMKQAEKFHRPVVCLIDTPGAYCGLGAEERGQGEAIARNLLEMSRLKVPIIAGIIGEGGSGGALALGIADKIFMQKNTVYSVLSPEGFASILWKDVTRAKEAAEQMKMTATDLLAAHMIDEIVEEPLGGAHKNKVQAATYLKNYLEAQLDDLTGLNIEVLLKKRYERFRKIGVFTEEK